MAGENVSFTPAVNPVKAAKDAMRAEYKEKRRLMDAGERERRDAVICGAGAALASFRFADYVLLYAATENEINLRALAERALSKGKKIAFPRCHKESHTMTYHFVSSYDELYPDSYGIPEPPADAPVYDGQGAGTAICFVPGIVFDKQGYRIGYGKGFYDRFLSSFCGSSIGVVYGDFILPSVPRGRYDVSVDVLLTENGVVNTSEN